MTGPLGASAHGSYFYLSYAHSTPLVDRHEADPDRWVRQFFGDLQAEVSACADSGLGLAPGFYDQAIPLGSNWKSHITAALGAAEAFVPLFSPGYFARSWPGKEWACFYERMVSLGVSAPMQRFVPVLWVPAPDVRDWPGYEMIPALEIAAPEYAENGLQALLRLRPYRAAYDKVVKRLAKRIVTLAEAMPVGASEVDLAQASSPFQAEASLIFNVSVAAPKFTSMPKDRQAESYGEDRRDWRPFPGEQERPLAEYAVAIAERFDFAVVTSEVEDSRKAASPGPGIVLIDPWFAADDRGLRTLRDVLARLRPSVLPVVITDGTTGAHAAQLRVQATELVKNTVTARTEAGRQAARGVRSLKEFVALMPFLIAEAERQHLRQGLGPRLSGGPAERRRAGGLDRLGRGDDSTAQVPEPGEDRDD